LTRDAIVQKLDAVLSTPIDSECKVVYVLAETRKLLKSNAMDFNLIALNLYCHWALHVDLHGEGTVRPFLEELDTYAASVLAGNPDIFTEQQTIRKLAFLEAFRKEFRQFLHHFGIPAAVCDDNARWQEFLQHYAGVIENGSISLADNKLPLKVVREVIFAKGRPTEPGSYIPFCFEWTIVLRNDKRIVVELEASAPGGNEMIFTKLTLH
jgi:hypothetical protein